MSNDIDMAYLGVMVDMAGCPNRCRHCWLGMQKNGNMSVDDFKEIAESFRNWRDENGRGIAEFSFFSWWREPDYRDDFRELWKLEQELSSPGRAQRFELLSTWRLARDETYAGWAATLLPKACQFTFFGMEDNTDWGMRRKGAFQELLLATERCIHAGIAPRWQLFLTKRCMNELDEFTRLMSRLDLPRRCETIGRGFEFFIGGLSPEGNAYELEDIRIERDDLLRIPQELVDVSRDGLALLGPKTESEWLVDLIQDHNPPNLSANIPCISVNADWDAYPNIAEPAEWWKLGNLKTDGVDAVLRAFRAGSSPGMKANRTIPVSELARRYGTPCSSKLYDRSDLLSLYMHRWGMEFQVMKGKE